MQQQIKICTQPCCTEFEVILNSSYNTKVCVHLYVKQHSITKMLYFGKTVKNDPTKYLGSGTQWVRHYKKHGKEFIETLKVWSFNYLPDATEFALKFSNDNNIVKSDEWANLVAENAINSGGIKGIKLTDKARKNISEGQKKRYASKEERLKQSEIVKNSWTPEKRLKHSEGQKKRYASKEERLKQSESITGRRLYIKNSIRKYFKTPPEDPDWKLINCV